jgi:transposase/transposase-like protein
LLSDGGHSSTGIAQLLGCSPETVKRIRRLYREGGLDALTPKRPPGRTSQATPTFREVLAQAVQTNPQTLGYGFATWSTARLAAAAPAQKKALGKDAPEALVFQDEVEIHRHPTLARVWAKVGTQPEVPAPGKNEKKVVYGGIDYTTGQTTYTVADTKSGMNFLAFLVALVAAYVGRKVQLVCDNGRFHQTKAVQAWLEANRDKVEIYWLPPYCPSLNLIERLWGHLKRTVLTNVLYATLDDLVAAFRRGMKRINGRKDQMGFMFNHDDLHRKKAG